jgi:hypothetical protein
MSWTACKPSRLPAAAHRAATLPWPTGHDSPAALQQLTHTQERRALPAQGPQSQWRVDCGAGGAGGRHVLVLSAAGPGGQAEFVHPYLEKPWWWKVRGGGGLIGGESLSGDAPNGVVWRTEIVPHLSRGGGRPCLTSCCMCLGGVIDVLKRLVVDLQPIEAHSPRHRTFLRPLPHLCCAVCDTPGAVRDPPLAVPGVGVPARVGRHVHVHGRVPRLQGVAREAHRGAHGSHGEGREGGGGARGMIAKANW